MEIEILSERVDFAALLASKTIDEIPEANIGTPQRVPGLGQSFHQLLCDLGVIALPVSVIGNVIAAWLLNALQSSPPKTRAKVVLRNGAKEAEFEIESERAGEVRRIVQAAVARVYRD